MIEIETLSPKAHRISVMGAFHHTDAKQVVEFAKTSHAEGKGGNILLDLSSLADFSLAAVSEELVHMPSLLAWLYGLDRIAVISDEAWLRTAARFESALLPGVEYQVYDDDEADAALAWVLKENDEPHLGAFEELELGEPGIAAFAITGRLDDAESERGVDLVRARLEQPDCARLMMVIKRWHGFEASVMVNSKVMSAKLELMDMIERYAIVGGPEWIHSSIGLFNALVKPELRAFDLDEQDKALAWLKE